VATLELLLANSLAVRNMLLARLAGVIHEILERCLSARTMGNHVRREGAVSRELILWMTRRLTAMNSTVVGPSAGIFAAERALEPIIVGRIVGVADLILLEAFHLLLNPSAIAPSLHCHIAGSTDTWVTNLCAFVLSTRKQIATWFSATPTVVVVGISAILAKRVLTTVARLGRA
jgi:hypothetical protein